MRRRFTVLMAAALAAIPAVVLVGGAGPAGAIEVSDEAGLRTAMETDAEIALLNDITLVNCGVGQVARTGAVGALDFDGRGHTVTQTCEDRVFFIDNGADATFRNVTVTGGRTNDDGGGIDMNGGMLAIVDSSIVGNCANNGGGVESESMVIRGSTFASNTAEGDGGAFSTDDDSADVTAVNSTFTGNTTEDTGALDQDSGTLTLVYVTIADNVFVPALPDCVEEVEPPAVPEEGVAADVDVAPDSGDSDSGGVDAGEVGAAAFPAANISATADGVTLVSFGSVVTGPEGGANCDLASPAQSLGYNFSDDATCGFTNVATGDRENAGSPGLGALASNGGPTQTMLPLAGSPLLDWIPLGACGGGNDLAGFPVTTDQRGVGRPQGPGCDVGAVEVEFVLSFTG